MRFQRILSLFFAFCLLHVIYFLLQFSKQTGERFNTSTVKIVGINLEATIKHTGVFLLPKLAGSEAVVDVDPALLAPGSRVDVQEEEVREARVELVPRVRRRDHAVPVPISYSRETEALVIWLSV